MISTPLSLLLVGCGRMGSAMAARWLDEETATAESLCIVEPDDNATSGLRQRYGLTPRSDLPARWTGDALILAVKPQNLDAVLEMCTGIEGSIRAAVSIAAGCDLRRLSSGLRDRCPVVRVMPNTPALIGRGVSVAVAGSSAGPTERALADRLMRAVGSVHWIENEALMDPVTAVSGSGPAYVFLLAETLAEAAVREGLDRDLAEALARATVTGAASLLEVSERPPSDLREDVTSPGGTTEAALQVLMGEDGLRDLMIRAVARASRRSRELA